MLVRQVAKKLMANQKIEVLSVDEKISPGAWFFESPEEIRPELMELEVFGICSKEASRWKRPDWRFEHTHYISLYVGKIEVGECT